MKAEEAIRSFGALGDLPDGNRRRVAGEDC